MIVGKKLTASKSRIAAERLSGNGIFAKGPLPSDFDFTNNGSPLTAFPAILTAYNATYTRASTKTVLQDGVLVTLASGQFGTSYDATTGLYGYEAQPAATNLATYSDGNASTYTVSNVVDGTAVTGFTNGIAFGDNSVQRSATKAISVTSGTVYSISFFVIMDDLGAPVVGTTNILGDFSIALNAVITTTKLERVIGSNVYRVSASITASATASHAAGCIKYTGQSARTFRTTAIQVETGSRATSYIATTAATASRAADVLSVPLANIPGFSSAAYTLFGDVRADVVQATDRRIGAVTDGTTNNRIYLAFTTANTDQTFVSSGGVAQANIDTGSVASARRKRAASMTSNNLIASTNGANAGSDTSVTMPVSPTELQIGHFNSSIQFNGFIFRAGLVPAALTQAQINGMTS